MNIDVKIYCYFPRPKQIGRHLGDYFLNYILISVSLQYVSSSDWLDFNGIVEVISALVPIMAWCYSKQLMTLVCEEWTKWIDATTAEPHWNNRFTMCLLRNVKLTHYVRFILRVSKDNITAAHAATFTIYIFSIYVISNGNFNTEIEINVRLAIYRVWFRSPIDRLRRYTRAL